MDIKIGGEEAVAATRQQLWDALNDPDVLTKCVPGCKSMTATASDRYTVDMQLKVAAVGGSFAGEIALVDKTEPTLCRMEVSGSGTLGTGAGHAAFSIDEKDEGGCLLKYEGDLEVGGLVAGVGQRILGSVSKHLVKQFFKALHKHFAAADAAAAAT